MTDAWFQMDAYSDGITAFSNTNYSQDVAPTPSKRYVRMLDSSDAVRVRDIRARDGVKVIPAGMADVTVLADVGTADGAARALEKKNILTLIEQFVSDGFSCVRERPSMVSRDSADAAKALFSILLPSRQTPKIAPDGEGGLIAVWDVKTPHAVLVIDNWKLHLVTAAATQEAQYFDELSFDGESVPDAISEFIPR
ncbi:hypothetical protein [Burkholderia sp. S171]|uniref:hypothetical protein n=1 Tax=Burkholderia sp. S171 TaxID=1641860 RepID=UPI00131E931F|nr:hypothetical protein [Burkholderia sp. S171]